MEYILTVLGLVIAGLVALVFRQKSKIQVLDNDVKVKDYQVSTEKKRRNLAMKKAALEGARHGAEKAVQDLTKHLRDNYNIEFNPGTGRIEDKEKIED